jgi:hypothetical protein
MSLSLSGNKNRAFADVTILLRSLKEHRMAWPFLRPVDISDFPDYTEVVEHPIDFQSIERKLNTRQYKFLQDFVSDVNRTFQNARLYNDKESAIVNCADIVGNYFTAQLRLLMERFRRRT